MFSRWKVMRTVISALMIEEMAMPARSVEFMSYSPLCWAITKTMNQVNAAPIMAPMYVPVNVPPMMAPSRPQIIAIAAPRALPEDIPRTEGSAIGLRKMPCITAPTVASAPPTNAPIATRGSLIR